MLRYVATNKYRHVLVILRMDKRIKKTNERIKEAYLRLLFKIAPNKIQVKDLCLEAKINRSTFYERFGFLENLEASLIEEELLGLVTGDIQIDALPLENEGISRDIIHSFIRSFVENKILLRFCTVEGREKYVDIIAHKQIEICARSLSKITYYQAYFQCIGALAALIEWINDPHGQTLEEMVDILYRHSIAMLS